jgi:septum formation topological specificity factor MinE
MFNRVMEWYQTVFGTPSSSSVAKDRLRLVLLSDHLTLAPDVLEAMRRTKHTAM